MELTKKEIYLVIGRYYCCYDCDEDPYHEGPGFSEEEILGVFDSAYFAQKCAKYAEKEKEDDSIGIYDTNVLLIEYCVNEKGEVFIPFGSEDKFKYAKYLNDYSVQEEIDLTKLSKFN